MKPTTEAGKSAFGKLKNLGKKKEKPEDKPQTFADAVVVAHEKLHELVTTKEAELKAEKGRENYNQLALAKLCAMEFHLESIIELASEYDQG